MAILIVKALKISMDGKNIVMSLTSTHWSVTMNIYNASHGNIIFIIHVPTFKHRMFIFGKELANRLIP